MRNGPRDPEEKGCIKIARLMHSVVWRAAQRAIGRVLGFKRMWSRPHRLGRRIPAGPRARQSVSSSEPAIEIDAIAW